MNTLNGVNQWGIWRNPKSPWWRRRNRISAWAAPWQRTPTRSMALWWSIRSHQRRVSRSVIGVCIPSRGRWRCPHCTSIVRAVSWSDEIVRSATWQWIIPVAPSNMLRCNIAWCRSSVRMAVRGSGYVSTSSIWTPRTGPSSTARRSIRASTTNSLRRMWSSLASAPGSMCCCMSTARTMRTMMMWWSRRSPRIVIVDLLLRRQIKGRRWHEAEKRIGREYCTWSAEGEGGERGVGRPTKPEWVHSTFHSLHTRWKTKPINHLDNRSIHTCSLGTHSHTFIQYSWVYSDTYSYSHTLGAQLTSHTHRYVTRSAFKLFTQTLTQLGSQVLIHTQSGIHIHSSAVASCGDIHIRESTHNIQTFYTLTQYSNTHSHLFSWLHYQRALVFSFLCRIHFKHSLWACERCKLFKLYSNLNVASWNFYSIFSLPYGFFNIGSFILVNAFIHLNLSLFFWLSRSVLG